MMATLDVLQEMAAEPRDRCCVMLVSPAEYASYLSQVSDHQFMLSEVFKVPVSSIKLSEKFFVIFTDPDELKPKES